MRLDQSLVEQNLCESRTEAQELIEAGFVTINNLVTTKRTRQVKEGDTISVTSRRRYVSRGGEKLDGVLHDAFSTDSGIHMYLDGKSALDVGSSTGGFSDCLLSYGVEHIDAVDVGSAQLHEKVKSSSKVSIFENTDIRSFHTESGYDVVVCDVSFISLSVILERLIILGALGTHYFLLIKPQFEVGKGNTKKGIVKNLDLVKEILASYKVLGANHGLQNIEIYPCHLAGGDGNQEYFLYGVLQ